MMSKTRGFSLIEMLVVMTIMGLIVSVVTLSSGVLSPYSSDGNDDSAEVFADKLMLLMSTASAEAILSGEPLALSFAISAATEEEGVAVSWLRYGRPAGGSVRTRQPVWQPVSADTGLQALPLATAISSDLVIEGELIDPHSFASSAAVPVLVFYPTGETTGFSWTLARDEQSITLTNAATGEIERRQP
ncbi:MAG: GspH/FimT family pseudopilin [Pseudohongiella sp.]|uniref:Tfp pilus assembly protein FimT/FimU n=1 Tax=Pseudohongiella sp. TaxID=1979412 RepID=UPI0034A01FAF